MDAYLVGTAVAIVNNPLAKLASNELAILLEYTCMITENTNMGSRRCMFFFNVRLNSLGFLFSALRRQLSPHALSQLQIVSAGLQQQPNHLADISRSCMINLHFLGYVAERLELLSSGCIRSSLF
jgi:hypothetical protein